MLTNLEKSEGTFPKKISQEVESDIINRLVCCTTPSLRKPIENSLGKTNETGNEEPGLKVILNFFDRTASFDQCLTKPHG